MGKFRTRVEVEATRGMKEVNAQLALESTQDVSEYTIKAGAQLLSEFVAKVNKDVQEKKVPKVTPQSLITYLNLLIFNTEFADAVVMDRGTAQPDTYRTHPAFDTRMQVMLGDYYKDAYNIWFQRSEDKWILNFNKVPKEGNFRSQPKN